MIRNTSSFAPLPTLGVKTHCLPKTDRVNNRAQLVPILEAVPHPHQGRLLAALEAAKVPCGAINNLAEVDPTSRIRPQHGGHMAAPDQGRFAFA
jgi:crotonobetainyl-CoA:carnitine CoA-transferase CaiB-like acyl-CoA transferase